jgi:hypothetical protein
MSETQQISDACEPSHPSLLPRSDEESEVPDVKASRDYGQREGHPHRGQRRLSRGDMLPVILISILFNLIHFGAKPSGGTMQRDSIVISRSGGQSPPDPRN